MSPKEMIVSGAAYSASAVGLLNTFDMASKAIIAVLTIVFLSLQIKRQIRLNKQDQINDSSK